MIEPKCNDDIGPGDAGGGGGGIPIIPTFDQMPDTPPSKIGNALKVLRVNAAETLIQYVEGGEITSDFFPPIDFDTETSIGWNTARSIKSVNSPVIINLDTIPPYAPEGHSICLYVDEIDNTNTVTLNAAAAGYTIKGQPTFTFNVSNLDQINRLHFDGTGDIDVKLENSDITDLSNFISEYGNLNATVWDFLDGNYFLRGVGSDFSNFPNNFPLSPVGDYVIAIFARTFDNGDVAHQITINRVSTAFVSPAEYGRTFYRAGSPPAVRSTNGFTEVGTESTYLSLTAISSPLNKTVDQGGSFRLRSLNAGAPINVTLQSTQVSGALNKFWVTDMQDDVNIIAGDGAIENPIEGQPDVNSYPVPDIWEKKYFTLVGNAGGETYTFKYKVPVFITLADFNNLDPSVQNNQHTLWYIEGINPIIGTFTDNQIAAWNSSTEQLQPATETEFEANKVPPARYSGIYFEGAYPIPSSSGANFAKITNLTNDLLTVTKADGINFIADEYIILRSGFYMGIGVLSVMAGNNNSDFTVRIMIDDGVAPPVKIGAGVPQSASSTNKETSIALHAPAFLANVNDKIYMEITDTSPALVNINAVNFTLLRCG